MSGMRSFLTVAQRAYPSDNNLDHQRSDPLELQSGGETVSLNQALLESHQYNVEPTGLQDRWGSWLHFEGVAAAHADNAVFDDIAIEASRRKDAPSG